MNRLLVITSLIFLLTRCNNVENNSQEPAPENEVTAATPWIGFTIKNTYPKDTSYFTEGLEFYEGGLLESSGGDAAESPFPSAWGKVDLKTGKNKTLVQLDNHIFFGEGITVWKDKIYQLTWKNQTVFQYDIKTFKKLREFTLPTKEGWGLTHDTASLLMSDGSSTIYMIDPETFRIKNTLSVHDYSGPVANINELEYVNGIIYANQWLSPYILRIDARNGEITGKIDLTKLDQETSQQYPNTFGLNGIAYDANKGTLWITGKKWPKFYELQLQ